MRFPQSEGGGRFIEWLDAIDGKIKEQGCVKVLVSCDGNNEWHPTYEFPDGFCYAPVEAYYDSLDEAVYLTAVVHVLEAETNRSIQLVGKFDINNITEETTATFTIKEEQH